MVKQLLIRSSRLDDSPEVGGYTFLSCVFLQQDLPVGVYSKRSLMVRFI